MARFATTLCFAFFFYIAQCSAETVSNATFLVDQDIALLNKLLFTLGVKYSSTQQTITAASATLISKLDSAIQKIHNEAEAILASAKASNTTACREQYEMNLSAYQQKVIACIKDILAAASNRYNAAKDIIQRVLNTLQSFLARISKCRDDVLQVLCSVSGILKEFTTFKSNSDYLWATSPDTVDTIFNDTQSKIDNCSELVSAKSLNQTGGSILGAVKNCVDGTSFTG